jgi:two-component system cell cycle sensor histidine kinase/response regulator CckA
MFWLYFLSLSPIVLIVLVLLYDLLRATARPPLARRTILLVDDDSRICEVTVKNLQRRGFRVLWAMDGETALRLANAQPRHIDLLITDVVMPRMSGLELAQRVRARRPSLPVLLISGAIEQAEISETGEGMAFLGKPFSTDTLMQKLHHLSKMKPCAV